MWLSGSIWFQILRRKIRKSEWKNAWNHLFLTNVTVNNYDHVCGFNSLPQLHMQLQFCVNYKGHVLSSHIMISGIAVICSFVLEAKLPHCDKIVSTVHGLK